MPGRDRLVGRKPTETELELAKALGLREAGLYKSLGNGSGLGTLFTSPPQFSTNPNWVPALREEARKRGIALIDSANPDLVSKDLLNKLKEKQEA